MPKAPKPVTPGQSCRVTRKELADRLRCGLVTVYELLREGKFTIITDRGRKHGARVFVPRDEAEYAERHGVEALQAWRKAKRRVKAS